MSVIPDLDVQDGTCLETQMTKVDGLDAMRPDVWWAPQLTAFIQTTGIRSKILKELQGEFIKDFDFESKSMGTLWSSVDSNDTMVCFDVAEELGWLTLGVVSLNLCDWDSLTTWRIVSPC